MRTTKTFFLPFNLPTPMRTNTNSQAAFFNPRLFGAFLLCSAGAWLAMLSFASTPSSGTLTPTSGPISYTAGPFFVSNPTPIIELDSGPECGGSSQPCDDFALTVSLPSGYHTSNPNASVKVTLSWTGSAGGVPGFGGPDPTAPGVPRYQNFFAPDNTSAQSSAGEFNIGYNPKTGRIMNMNLGPVWRITPPELLTPAKPECCEGLWEDK